MAYVHSCKDASCKSLDSHKVLLNEVDALLEPFWGIWVGRAYRRSIGRESLRAKGDVLKSKPKDRILRCGRGEHADLGVVETQEQAARQNTEHGNHRLGPNFVAGASLVDLSFTVCNSNFQVKLHILTELPEGTSPRPKGTKLYTKSGQPKSSDHSSSNRGLSITRLLLENR